jgi:hypothetical protein
MNRTLRILTAAVVILASLPVAACGRSSNKQQSAPGVVGTPSYNTSPSAAPTAYPADTARTPRHHSKVKGAMAGASAGHLLGHHAVSGAAAGAVVQHERNKHPK